MRRCWPRCWETTAFFGGQTGERTSAAAPFYFQRLSPLGAPRSLRRRERERIGAQRCVALCLALPCPARRTHDATTALLEYIESRNSLAAPYGAVAHPPPFTTLCVTSCIVLLVRWQLRACSVQVADILPTYRFRTGGLRFLSLQPGTASSRCPRK